jgi:hypothetical protein
MNLASTSARSGAPTGGAPSRAPSPIQRTGSVVTRALSNLNNGEPQKDNNNASDAAAITERLATTTRSQELLEVMERTDAKMEKEKRDKAGQEEQQKWAELNRKSQKEALEAQMKTQQAAGLAAMIGQAFGAAGQIISGILEQIQKKSQGEQQE